MRTSPFHPAHDKLLAQVRVSRQRLDRFANRLREQADAGSMDLDDRETFLRIADDLRERCDDLVESIKAWTEVQIGVPTAADDVATAVEALEADFDAARAVSQTNG